MGGCFYTASEVFALEAIQASIASLGTPYFRMIKALLVTG
jgi:hypothetical protein